MKELVKLVILSHNRAGNVTTFRAFDNCALCVEESQEAAYREHYPDVEIIVHPDEVKGLSPKIRWVYENFRNVVMLDDDLHAVVRNYNETGDEFAKEMEPNVAYDLMQSMAYTCHEAGIKLFGFYNSPQPMQYRSIHPIKLSGFVQGGVMGFLDGFKMVLPDECVSACDYYLSGVNAYFHRLAWIDRRFCAVSKGTFKTRGGMADFRTMQTEEEDYRLLKHAFGDAISLKKESPLKKLQHRWERTLHVEW